MHLLRLIREMDHSALYKYLYRNLGDRDIYAQTPLISQHVLQSEKE